MCAAGARPGSAGPHVGGPTTAVLAVGSNLTVGSSTTKLNGFFRIYIVAYAKMSLWGDRLFWS